MAGTSKYHKSIWLIRLMAENGTIVGTEFVEAIRDMETGEIAAASLRLYQVTDAALKARSQ